MNRRGEARTHTSHLGRRFSAKPLLLGGEPASMLLGDILDANLDERAERAALRDWLRRALRSAKLRAWVADTRKLDHGAIHLTD